MASLSPPSSFLHLQTCKQFPSALPESGKAAIVSRSSSSRLVALPSLKASTLSTLPATEEESSASPSQVQVEHDPASSQNAAKDWKLKGSSQLTRWARTRKLRSGKPSPPLLEARTRSWPSTVELPSPDMEALPIKINTTPFESDSHDSMVPASIGQENAVYMVSDGTGWTAEHSVHAALGQFEHCLVDHGCPVSTHLFSEINDVERLMEIIRDAGKEQAVLVYTLADPALAEAAKKACELHSIPHLDLFGPITELLSSFLGVTPSGLPRGAPGRKSTLSKQYFKRIEAVEFTIKQDDGALPKNLHKADLVLVGVSRTSKTPLSTYIAQKGYKVANVPLVLGIDPPNELFQIDQDKIYALTINPNFLHSIRTARSKTLGVANPTVYSEMDHIKKELDFSRKLFVENPKWPVIEVTGKAIEETAAVILRTYHDRERKYVMPRISWRY